MYKKILLLPLLLIGAGLILSGCASQTKPVEADFYYGVDLSYVNEVEDCGAQYFEGGELRDPFELFADHGTNLVRARLWHNPAWTEYSTLADVKKTFSRAREAGMATLLDIHYSDDWADPGTQNIPAAWEGIDDEDELAEAIYQYTYDTLLELDEAGLMPTFVQVGNETNSGMLKEVMKLDWPRDARLFNAGIQAVRDAGAATKTEPRVILHVAQPENTGWWFSEAEEYGLTDFDVIGISFYPQWSSYSITDMGSQVSYLRQRFGKEIMVVETAYPWTYEAVDETAANIITSGMRGYPASPQGQRQFMLDLTQSLISNGALGVVYWEPAWVSTPCSTRWGQGSHWENVTFFDFQNNNEVLNSIDFLNYAYSPATYLVDGVIEEIYGEALMQDAAGDNLEQSARLDLLDLYATQDSDSLLLAIEVAGDIYAEDGGGFVIYLDATGDTRGANIDAGKRPITVSDPYKPEFRIDLKIVNRNGTINVSTIFYNWDGQAWQESTLTGAIAVHAGTPSVVEIQIPRSALNSPEMVNVGVVSVGRGRIHTAGDVLGTTVSASEWEEALALDTFANIQFAPAE